MAKSAKRKSSPKGDAKRRVAPKKDVGRIRLGSMLLAAGALLVVVGLFVLLRPEPPGSAAASPPPPAITPDLRLALPGVVGSPVPATTGICLDGSCEVTPAVAKPSAATVKRIAPEELHRRLRETSPPLVWEIRSKTAYEKQHIPGSQLVTMAEVTALAQSLDREQAIVINCD